MKRILYILTAALTVAFVACNKGEEPADPNAKHECSVKILVSSLDDSAAVGDNGDILAIQVYTILDGVDTPYANGLFSDWNKLEFKGYTNTSYRVVATLVVDAQKRIYSDGEEVYGKPFEAVLAEVFSYGDEELSALSKSTAKLADGTLSVVPNVDRYYGEATKDIKTSDCLMDVSMSRVAFGVKPTGELEEGESVVIKIAGAPEVELAKDEVEVFTFQYIAEAYAAAQRDYRENINTEVLRCGGVIFSDNIIYKRNKIATLTIEKDGVGVGFEIETPFEDDKPVTDATPYVTQVFDYCPAPGQYVNTMPQYEDGDTQQTMNDKVLEAIGNNNQGMITLGSYGGYVTVGFDHTIENKAGKLDFRVLGNAFYSATNSGDMSGASCEPGIIMVSVDANGNGIPDDEWYEIQGSAHKDHTKELWYNKAVESGNDVNFYYADYSITYSKPDSSFDEDTPSVAWKSYIPWSDNKENSGFIEKSMFHKQVYFPQWISSNTLTFVGSRLPQNGITETESVLYKFEYGYADNAANDEKESAIDISWAVDADGKSVSLEGVDFIKVYNGVMQTNGLLGETSTEFCGVTDLHLSGEDIDSFIAE